MANSMSSAYFGLRKLAWTSVTNVSGSPCFTHGHKLVLGADAMRNPWPLTIAVVCTLQLPVSTMILSATILRYICIIPDIGDTVFWVLRKCWHPWHPLVPSLHYIRISTNMLTLVTSEVSYPIAYPMGNLGASSVHIPVCFPRYWT